MTNTVLVYGYHGTSAEAAASILQNGFRISNNDYDWLGAGVYFWQDAPERAWQWAIQCYQSDAAVICSLISLDLDNCVDLLDIAWHPYLNRAYYLMEAEYGSRGQTLPRQTSGAHRLDRAVINYLVEQILEPRGQRIEAVRAAFPEGEPVFPGSAIEDRAHVQIAIRSPNCIRGSWLIKRTGGIQEW